MGCQPAKIETMSSINLSIIEQSFMKPQNAKIKQKMIDCNINYQYYLSIACFLEQFTKRYTNQIVVGLDNYHKIYEYLKKLNYRPNIYVIGKSQEKEENLPYNITFLNNYNQLIQLFIIKERRRKDCNDMLKTSKSSKDKKIAVKILQKNTSKQTSEEFIFHQTLKAKNISHQIYESYQHLQQSMYQKDSHFIVSDYVYHNEVINLVGKSTTKVICFCQLAKQEVYNPKVYFISNNFLEISSEIASEISVKHLKHIKCSKLYLYTSNILSPNEYSYNLEKHGFEVRLFSDLQKMLLETTFFFCVSVLAAESQINTLQKYLQKNSYQHKIKIISIPKNVQGNDISMRKIIKQCKKGYRAQKSITRSIDIIDKHYDNVKFEEIKNQLENNNIACFGYKNLNQYTKTKKLISPFIICSYQQKSLLNRYLNQIQSTSKIIVFCNKNKITTQFKDSKQFAYVSSHFGKIITFIKKTPVYQPKIIVEKQIKINQKVQKLKNKNKRISALKWCGLAQQNAIHDNNQNNIKEQQFEFINIANSTNFASIKQLQKDASILWKLDYKPFNNFMNFKHDLVDSLTKLKKNYKINYPQNHFISLMNEIQNTSISKLLNKVKQFFESENQLGLSINNTLLKIETLSKNDILMLREFIFLVNINFLSFYKFPKLGKIKLCNYRSKTILQKCQIGSYLLTKNYNVFYEDLNGDPLGQYKIITEIDFNSLSEQQIAVNTFFRYKEKYIFSPYTQFIVKSINISNKGIKIIQLQHIKNVEFLKYYYCQNITVNIIDIYKNATKNDINQENDPSQLIDNVIYNEVKLNTLRLTSLMHFYKNNTQLSIDIHKKIIKQEEELENLDSVKISQLNYQLATFYIASNNLKEGGQLIKQILSTKPIQYIKNKCEQMIMKLQNNLEPDVNIKQDENNTFQWLKDNKSQQQQQQLNYQSQYDSIEEEEKVYMNERSINNYNNQIYCLDIKQLQQNDKNKLEQSFNEDNKQNSKFIS